MGTRGLIGFVIKGKRKGSYNWWDSYPQSLGKVLMEFLMSLSEEDMIRFQARLENIVWVDSDDFPSEDLERRYAPLSELAEPDPHKSFCQCTTLVTWHELLKPVTFGRALPLIHNGELDHLVNDMNFDYNPIFWEYAYYIDMEKRVLVIDGLQVDGGVIIPFGDFREGLMSDLRAYGVEYSSEDESEDEA